MSYPYFFYPAASCPCSHVHVHAPPKSMISHRSKVLPLTFLNPNKFLPYLTGIDAGHSQSRESGTGTRLAVMFTHHASPGNVVGSGVATFYPLSLTLKHAAQQTTRANLPVLSFPRKFQRLFGKESASRSEERSEFGREQGGLFDRLCPAPLVTSE